MAFGKYHSSLEFENAIKVEMGDGMCISFVFNAPSGFLSRSGQFNQTIFSHAQESAFMVFWPKWREKSYHNPYFKCDVRNKNLPDVEADNLIAVRLVERILIHMIAISFTQNTSLSSLCIQFFQTFDIGFHSVPAILFDLESKGKKLGCKTL